MDCFAILDKGKVDMLIRHYKGKKQPTMQYYSHIEHINWLIPISTPKNDGLHTNCSFIFDETNKKNSTIVRHIMGL